MPELKASSDQRFCHLDSSTGGQFAVRKHARRLAACL